MNAPFWGWGCVVLAFACVLAIAFGFTLLLGTRRKIGLYLVWIPGSLLIVVLTVAFLLWLYG